jgi:hypothetical protein
MSSPMKPADVRNPMMARAICLRIEMIATRCWQKRYETIGRAKPEHEFAVFWSNQIQSYPKPHPLTTTVAF